MPAVIREVGDEVPSQGPRRGNDLGRTSPDRRAIHPEPVGHPPTDGLDPEPVIDHQHALPRVVEERVDRGLGGLERAGRCLVRLGQPVAAPTTLHRHFRDNGWALRVPRRVHELAKPQQDAFDLLRQGLGRSPTVAEVADLMRLPLSELEAAQRARHARSTTWVDAGGSEGSEPRHAVGEIDSGLVSVEDRMADQVRAG
jgi:hypothetical protein